jgi:hypothetical protein
LLKRSRHRICIFWTQSPLGEGLPNFNYMRTQFQYPKKFSSAAHLLKRSKHRIYILNPDTIAAWHKGGLLWHKGGLSCPRREKYFNKNVSRRTILKLRNVRDGQNLNSTIEYYDFLYIFFHFHELKHNVKNVNLENAILVREREKTIFCALFRQFLYKKKVIFCVLILKNCCHKSRINCDPPKKGPFLGPCRLFGF